jgi:hypothetical protein
MKEINLIILIFFTVSCYGKNYESQMLDSLDFYIKNEQNYREKKEECIKNLKSQIADNRENNEQLYEIYDALFTQYKSYIYDSALYYSERLLTISQYMADDCKKTDAKIKLCFCYLSAGLFTEAFNVLKNTAIENCDNELKISFYMTKARLYYDLADFNNDEFRVNYETNGNQIMLQALELLPQNSIQYYASLGLKEMKSKNYVQAISAFEKIINSKNCTQHDFAIATSSLAYIYFLLENRQKEKEFLIKAAIADIKSSTMETVALKNLAQHLYYNNNDVFRAAKYIRKAFQDAHFYNARHRQMEIGNILPIIEDERVKLIENQKNTILLFLISISFLTICLIIALCIIIWQLKKLHKAKAIIQRNIDHLRQVNESLIEANRIKEEYIGNFFYLDAIYIEKLEAFQHWVLRKVETRQYMDLQIIPEKLDVLNDREKLFRVFDETFLNIFPNFISEFNKLLKPDKQIRLRYNELLNNDLRIYALMRLGVRSNEKIAQFLNYSVNTIYSYKIKMNSRTIHSNLEFKQRLMEIKSI